MLVCTVLQSIAKRRFGHLVYICIFVCIRLPGYANECMDIGTDLLAQIQTLPMLSPQKPPVPHRRQQEGIDHEVAKGGHVRRQARAASR